MTCSGSHSEFVTSGLRSPECRFSSWHSWGQIIGPVAPVSPQVLDMGASGGFSVSGVGGGGPRTTSHLSWAGTKVNQDCPLGGVESPQSGKFGGCLEPISCLFRRQVSFMTN